MKKVLILSHGPVPVPEQDKVEGGGLRCFGLANGLQAQKKELEITVSYNASYKKEPFTSEINGILVKTWQINALPELIAHFDSIIVSYNAGDLTNAVVDNIRDDQQLVLDGYVPIHIEMSARNAKDLEFEYDAFNFENANWIRALRRGDILLCASESQHKFYTGVMASVGRINPITYGDNNLIQIVPYGIYENQPVSEYDPIKNNLVNEDSFRLLWFGGIYPWFDLENLLYSIKEVNRKVNLELIMVGVKNPFNNHPDFVRKYKETVNFIENNGLGEVVHLVDWIDFNDRANWYMNSDAVITINKIGVENSLAWRTRLVDYIWADLPVITNGGDPVSDLLESEDALIKLPDLKAETITENIINTVQCKGELKKIAKNMIKVRKNIYWHIVTEKLSVLVEEKYQPGDLVYREKILMGQQQAYGKIAKLNMKIKAGSELVKRSMKRDGFSVTAKIILVVLKQKIAQKFPKLFHKKYRKPRIVVISHQLDNTGAPFVAMNVMERLSEKYPELIKYVRFVTFVRFKSENIKKMNRIGIKPEIYVNRDTLIDFYLGDLIVLNSFGLSREVVHSAIDAINRKKARHIFWYGHEAEPDSFVGEDFKNIFRSLLNRGKATIYSVSEKCLEEYQRFFETRQNIFKMVPEFFGLKPDQFRVIPAGEFEKLNFICLGAVADGRKGQLPILYAFLDFYHNFYKKNPEKYRDFELKFVGVDGEGGYIRKQLEISAKDLGERIKIIGQVDHDRALQEVAKSNVTLCYSVHEALPIFVLEGMGSGHPIIRNDCAGQVEQLIEGKNGFGVRSDDFNGLVEVIEKISNKCKVNNEELGNMSRESEKIARSMAKNKYQILDVIKEKFDINL